VSAVVVHASAIATKAEGTSLTDSAIIVWKGSQRTEGGWENGVELVVP